MTELGQHPLPLPNIAQKKDENPAAHYLEGFYHSTSSKEQAQASWWERVS